MKVPKSRTGQFAFFFLMEFISFFIICASTRAQAKGSYAWTGVTSILFSLQAFLLAKMMVEDASARTWWAGAGSIVGGCVGDLASVWATMHLF